MKQHQKCIIYSASLFVCFLQNRLSAVLPKDSLIVLKFTDQFFQILLKKLGRK